MTADSRAAGIRDICQEHIVANVFIGVREEVAVTVAVENVIGAVIIAIHKAKAGGAIAVVLQEISQILQTKTSFSGCAP